MMGIRTFNRSDVFSYISASWNLRKALGERGRILGGAVWSRQRQRLTIADQTGANPVERAEMADHLCSPVLCSTVSAKDGRGSDKGGERRDRGVCECSELRPINNGRPLLVDIRICPSLYEISIRRFYSGKVQYQYRSKPSRQKQNSYIFRAFPLKFPY